MMGLIWTVVLFLCVTYVWQTVGTNNDESFLCVYSDPNNSTHYPNYCSHAGNSCSHTYEVCPTCNYYGSQKFSNPQRCESYRRKNESTALYCFYTCYHNKSSTFPNECIDRGRVCQWNKKNCSAPDVTVFENMEKCNQYQQTGIMDNDYNIDDGDTTNTNRFMLVILLLVACIVLLIIILVCCMFNQYHSNWCKSMFIISFFKCTH